jgi:hypothetical protein
MTIIAKDANGSSYYVTKLAARKCRLVQKTMVGSYVYADGTMARWTLGWGNATGTDATVPGTKVGIETNAN